MLTADRLIDRRILRQADSLEQAGWKVTIIAMPLDDNADDDGRVVRIGTASPSAKRENLVLDVYRWVRQHFPMNGIFMRWAKRLTWRYLVDQEVFYSRLFQSTVARFSPTVLVAHDLPMLPVAMQMADACGARLVYDSHELYSEQEFSDREKRRWTEIEARYIRFCDVVITVNKSIATELERRYGIDDVKVIYNAERSAGVPARTRRLHDTFGLAAEKKILLLQGGLSSGRNLEVLVDAMKHVRDESVVLVMLGNGVLRNKLKARALRGKVYFHPAVPQKELLALTAAADAGVIPYQATCLNNLFCTPNKLFEFITASIPILASDLPEISAIVDKEQIGLVGDMSTAQKVAVLIDDFFSDVRRLEMWRENVKAVRQHICWENEEQKLINVFEALR